MRYAILMYTDPDHTRAMSRDEIEAIKGKHERLGGPLLESGELIGGAGLAFPEETTLMRLGPDGVHSETRPFAPDTVEQLSAYYEVECEGENRAREIAAQILDDHVTAIELRRIHDTVDERMA